MRTREAIQERLKTLMQAYQFSFVHQHELSEEGRVKLRALEENIQLLKWCLEPPEAREITWVEVRNAFQTGWNLLKLRLFGGPPSPLPVSETSTPHEAAR